MSASGLVNRSEYFGSPGALLADTVAKIENRTAPENLAKVDLGLLYRCNAL